MAQQYIGSSISLISKSDIRYRGILHSIDPAASTVSLEHVRSMGTEGRKNNPAQEIAPTDTLYEFIVFRAADVKDLSIEAPAEPKPEPPKPSVPDDPAIMSTTAPPRHQPGSNPYMQQQMLQASQALYNNPIQPIIYPPGNVPPQWAPYCLPPPGQMHPIIGFPPQQPPIGSHQAPSSAVQSSAKPAIAPGPAKTPVPAGKPELEGSSYTHKNQSQSSSSPAKQLPNTPARSGSTPAAPAQKSGTIPAKGPTNSESAQKSVFGTPTAMDMMATIAGMNPGGPANQSAKAGGPKTGPHAATSQVKKQSNLPPPTASTQTQNGAPSSSQAQQTMRHPLPVAPSKPKPQPKAEHSKQAQPSPAPVVPGQDFDFASANAKFTKTGTGVGATNGSNLEEGEVAELSGAVASVSLGEKEDFFIPEAPPGTYYDKKKSFFDNISSEVKERSAVTADAVKGSPVGGGGGGGPRGRGVGRGRGAKGWDRNAERQKNVDTFGDVALNLNLGALGSGYNGYGRGGANRMGQMAGTNRFARGGAARGRPFVRGIGRGGGPGIGAGAVAGNGMRMVGGGIQQVGHPHHLQQMSHHHHHPSQ